MPNNTLLFGRYITVSIVSKTGGFLIPNDYEIEITVNYSGGKSDAIITINNAPEAAISTASKGDSISITAGYEKYSGVVFVGKITEVEIQRTQTGENLRIKAEVAVGTTKKKISITTGRNSSTKQIISIISAKIGVKINIDSKLQDKIYSNGFSFVGRAKKAIDQIAHRIKGVAITQSNGTISIIPAQDRLPSSETIVVTPDTGLVGYPQKITKNNRTGWKITSLLNHKMSVGTTVKVISDIKGIAENIYTIKDVKHTGSNRNNKLLTVAEIYKKGQRK